jgi:protein-L-isoaspartate(D-aspartate) O-methyltransferase
MSMDTETARFNMIEQQIRPWEVLDQDVLGLLATVRREDFVPPALQALAFVDTQVPLQPGRPGGVVMLEPKVEARLLQDLQLQPGDKVLEIGTGSGFMAALLGRSAREVTTLECDAELASLARRNLARAGVHNVRVVEVDAAGGAAGLPGEAPFDAIVLSGSVAEVPRALLEQLAPGGRLIAIVGDEPVMTARLYTRAAAGRGAGAAARENPAGAAPWSETELFDTVAPRLQGFAERPRFRF